MYVQLSKKGKGKKVVDVPAEVSTSIGGCGEQSFSLTPTMCSNKACDTKATSVKITNIMLPLKVGKKNIKCRIYLPLCDKCAVTLLNVNSAAYEAANSSY